MIRRLSLTSVVLLVVPQESELMRLVFAMVITLISLCAVALIAPYRRNDNNTLAIIAQLMLLFVLLVSMIIKLYKDFEDTSLSPATISRIMGFNSPFGFSIVIFGTCCVMALLTLSFMLYQAHVFIQTRRKQMSDAIGGLTRFKYSLNLISLAKFRAAGKLAKHEEMRDNGALTVFDLWEDALRFSQSGKIIIFFSHQWLGWYAPDPKNVHYPVMIQAIEKLCETFKHKPEDIYLWIDYSSIPQKNKSAQLAAIDSIANYAALSKYFIVVAPETIHCNTGLRCDAQTYLGRGWCRLEQWAGMSASTKTDHMYLYEAGDLHRLSDRQSWIEESVNVFTGNFTCNADKQKLVDVVMSLYAFCISCGRYKRSSSTKGGDSVAPHAKDGETGDTWLSALIDRNRKHIFPPEWFGDSIEILEAEIEKAIAEKPSKLFTTTAFDSLLRARQELCFLHGATLPQHITAKFGKRIAACAAAIAEKGSSTHLLLVPPGDAGRNSTKSESLVTRAARVSKESVQRAARASKERLGMKTETRTENLTVVDLVTPPTSLSVVAES